MAAPRITWTVDADRVHRATLPDGRRLWAWRSEPGCWHYGLTHPGTLGDVANDFTCHTPAQARADALAMVALLRVTCRPIRAMRAGTMRDVYSVHPVTGEGAHQHNTRRMAFGPVVPAKVSHRAAPSGRVGVLRTNDAKPSLTAAVVDPATESGDAYVDRQMAAYGVKPDRWTTDTLQGAHEHLVAAGTYPDHAARIAAELVRRDVPDAGVLAVYGELEYRRREWTRLWFLTPEDGGENDADRAFNTYGETVWPYCPDLVAKLIELRAVTPAGVRAKAAAAVAMLENGFHDGPDNEFDLQRSALRDAALLVVR